MKHIIRALVILVILYFAAQYYKYSEGIFNVISVFFLIAFIYLIVAVIGAIRRAVLSRSTTVIPQQNVSAKSTGSLWLFLIIIFLALTYTFKEVLGSYSFKIFLFLDNLVKITDTTSPLIFWGMMGLLVGAVYGSFVAWKKYKLNATINLIPLGIFVFFIAILYLVNKPLDATVFAATRNLQTEYAYSLVTATGYHSPQDKNAMYKPAFLLDNNDKTAWITDIDAAGANEEIRLSFGSLQNYAGKHLQCTGFAIKNGYRKSLQVWNNFARAKEITVKYNSSSITNILISDKNNDVEEIKINPITISSFDNLSISVNAVYPGEKYPARVAISELVPIIEYEKF